MTFAWPVALALLVLAPVVAAAYLLALRRRRRRAVTFSSLAVLRQALPRRTRWRRHVPLVALLVGLVALALAAARPRFTTTGRVREATIVLALDESGSMCSTDVAPNRIGAAERAARSFVDALPKATEAGLVAFNGSAQLAVAPTRDRATLVRAIDGLTTGGGTAIGSAILQSVDAISQVDSQVRPVGVAANGPSGASGSAPPAEPTIRPGEHGYVPDVVVVLTDGSNDVGISPIAAANDAAARGVRVYTIGFGTDHPSVMHCTARQLGGVAYAGLSQGPGGGSGLGRGGGGAFGSGTAPLVADFSALRRVAHLTGASSYRARNAAQLERLLSRLPTKLTVATERHELTVVLAALGAVLALLAAAASFRWSPYP